VTGIAASAQEALAMAGRDDVELVLMDIRIKGARDGVDAAIELRSTMNLPCIFVTAHAEQTLRQRAEPAKAIGWLEKPYPESLLIEAVNQALKSL
jgi:CheY-like chemotaxis protein